MCLDGERCPDGVGEVPRSTPTPASTTLGPGDGRRFLDEARAALAVLGSRTGFLDGSVGRAVDEAELWTVVTRWRDVGSYRRALRGAEAKTVVVPLLSTALDEPSVFEVLHAVAAPSPDGSGAVVTDSPSDLAADAGLTRLGAGGRPRGGDRPRRLTPGTGSGRWTRRARRRHGREAAPGAPGLGGATGPASGPRLGRVWADISEPSRRSVRLFLRRAPDAYLARHLQRKGLAWPQHR